MDDKTSCRDLDQALQSLRRAADAVADRILGKDATGHLREASRHVIKAARGALDRAEQELDRSATASGGQRPSDSAR